MLITNSRATIPLPVHPEFVTEKARTTWSILLVITDGKQLRCWIVEWVSVRAGIQNTLIFGYLPSELGFESFVYISEQGYNPPVCS